LPSSRVTPAVTGNYEAYRPTRPRRAVASGVGSGEQCLPVSWSEFLDAGGGVLGYALQHIDQVRVNIDSVQAAGDDQALHYADIARAEFGPAERPGFSSHRDHSQGTLEMIGIERYVRIGAARQSG
jgi:hypothetical protein